MNDIQHLSVIQIAPEQYVTILNMLAEAQGKGSNNLSVKLQDSEGNIFFGCHGWWTKAKYAEFKEGNIEGLELYADAINSVYERVIDTEGLADIALIPMQNFEAALSELGLSNYDSNQ